MVAERFYALGNNNAFKCDAAGKRVFADDLDACRNGHGGRIDAVLERHAAYLGNTVFDDYRGDILGVLVPRYPGFALVIGHLSGAGDGECAVSELPCQILAAAAAESFAVGEGRRRNK